MIFICPFFWSRSKQCNFLDAYATTEYEGCKILSYLNIKIIAVQFHPGKSGNRGLKFLNIFGRKKE